MTFLSYQEDFAAGVQCIEGCFFFGFFSSVSMLMQLCVCECVWVFVKVWVSMYTFLYTACVYSMCDRESEWECVLYVCVCCLSMHYVFRYAVCFDRLKRAEATEDIPSHPTPPPWSFPWSVRAETEWEFFTSSSKSAPFLQPQATRDKKRGKERRDFK